MINSNNIGKFLIKHLQVGLLLLLLSGIAIPGHSQIMFEDASAPMPIGAETMLLPDSGFTPNQALAHPGFEQSTASNPTVLNGKDVWHWVRFEVTNATDEQALRLLVHQPIIDQLHLFTPQADGSFHEAIVSQQLPFESRTYKWPTPAFDLAVSPGETRTFLLKVNGKEQYFLPMHIMSPNVMVAELSRTDRYIFMYGGVFVAMLIFNLFVFLKIRDNSYKLYLFYLLAVVLTQLSLSGYPFKMFWPNFPFVEQYASFIFPPLAGIAGLFFMRSFLNSRKYMGRLDYLTWAITAMYVLCVSIPVILGEYALAWDMLNLCAMCATVYMLSASTYMAIKKVENALIFLIAWAVFLVGIVIYAMKDLGVIPYNEWTRYTMFIGSAFEMIIITYAMADRLRRTEKDKHLAEQKELKLLREKEVLLAMQENEIAVQVKARTRELQSSNSQLNDAVLELEKVQQNLLTDYASRTSALEQKNLQLQMNPHFLFNSLSSIQMMVLDSNPKEAGAYLLLYASLMRSVLEHSRKEFVALELETKMLTQYIDLELLRFSSKFEYQITVPTNVTEGQYGVPSMIIQPYVENAILHGLLPKGNAGRLHISFSVTANDQLRCIVEDNGVGRAAQQPRNTSKTHESIGIEATMKRLNLLGEHLHQKAEVKIIDKIENEVSSGTKVEILLPVT